jgi:hypothetical protein
MKARSSKVDDPGVYREGETNILDHATPYWFWILLTGVCAVPKILFIILSDAHVGGDSYVYETVARNILDNFCVSMSAPATSECLPHWGGNQLPGYPGFIALVWLVAGKTVFAVLIAQSVVFAIAVTRLLLALAALGLSRNILVGGACLLGLSPSLIGFSRSLLTETLAAAAIIWLLGELIMSWKNRSLRIVPIGVICSIGLFIRYDFVLVCIPIAMAGILIHRPTEMFRRGVLIAIIASIPFGMWTVRSVAQGLPSTPPFGLTPQGERLPSGMLSWIGTWLDDQYELDATVWKLVRYDYKGFAPPANAYADDAERNRAETLLNDLRRNHQGAAPSETIDGAFMSLADSRSENAGFDRYILLPMRRLAHMWLSPFPSMGWPSEITGDERAKVKTGLQDGNWSVVATAAMDNFGAVFAKVTVALHRYLLIGIAIIALAVAWRARGLIGFATTIILSYVFTRSLFFAHTLLIETRYLMPALAWLDVLIILLVAFVASRKKTVQGRQ